MLALLASTPLALVAGDGMPANYRLLYEQKCDKAEAIRDFVFSDPAAWRMGKDEQGGLALELFEKSKYTPKHRSPFNIALIAGQRFGDFILELELLSTVKPYPHQDMCLYFGFEDTNKFYYAHLGMKRDPLAHQVTIVNDAPRTVIKTEATDGVAWGQNVWHKVRLERKASEGTIKVYFDDMTTPVQTANDKTFGLGYVGVGSFDDKGMVRNLRIYGAAAEGPKASFFKAAP
jgi:hypothetical protein